MKNSLIEYKRYKNVFLTLLVFFVGLYSFFMINQLTNVGDGFWQQNYYFAGDHEIQCGRWLWPFLDKVLRGIHVDPLTTFTSIILFIVGYIVIVDTLEINNNLIAIIGGVVLFSSPIISSILAYRYMSVTFSLAFLFSALAVWVCEKTDNTWLSMLLSAVFFSFSLGLYQAYAGVFCLVGALSVVIMLINPEKTGKDILMRFGRLIGSALLGGVIYYIILKIMLKINGFQLSSYNNANQVSLASIINAFPYSFRFTYSTFDEFLTGHIVFINELDNRLHLTLVVFIILSVIFLTQLVIYVVRNKDKLVESIIRAVLVVLILLLLPVLCNIAVMVVFVSVFMPQMGAAMAVYYGLLPVLVLKGINWDDKKISPAKTGIIVSVICSLVTVYGQSMQVLVDHSMMKEGYTGAVTMAEVIVNDLQRKDLLSTQKNYFFIGTPAHNEMFYSTELYAKANQYAKIGNFWLEGSNMYASYKALFQRVMGMDLNVLCDGYESLAFDEYYKSVPCFPEEGYIIDGDTVIIKVSEP